MFKDENYIVHFVINNFNSFVKVYKNNKYKFHKSVSCSGFRLFAIVFLIIKYIYFKN